MRIGQERGLIKKEFYDKVQHVQELLSNSYHYTMKTWQERGLIKKEFHDKVQNVQEFLSIFMSIIWKLDKTQRRYAPICIISWVIPCKKFNGSYNQMQFSIPNN